MRINELNQMTEQEYRDLPYPSYSTLKGLDTEGPSFLTKVQNKKDTSALSFGTLVDNLLTIKNYDLNEDFIIDNVETPTASLKILVDSIVERNMLNNLEDKDIDYLVAELGLWSKTKDPIKLRSKWDNEIFHTYINFLKEAENKIIISLEDYTKALECVDTLRTHEFTRDVFNFGKGKEEEQIFQLKRVYKIKQGDIDITLKSMLDLVNIDHKNKVIYPYDIKTGTPTVDNFAKNYLNYRYYLQESLYVYAIYDLMKKLKELRDYKVEPFKFIYISKSNPKLPVLIEGVGWEKGFTGFYTKSGYYREGVIDLLKDYRFYTEQQWFECKRKIVENNGIVKLDII